MKAEIAEIRQQLLNNEKLVSNTAPEIINESMREFGEIQSSQKNFMIFGANESATAAGCSRSELNTIMAGDILLKTYPFANIKGIKVFRVGCDNPAKNRQKSTNAVLKRSKIYTSVCKRVKKDSFA